jgi:hypothetical protein
MSESWQYQIRIYLGGPNAEMARHDPENSALDPLPGILAKHDAAIKCQFDAFMDYVNEAEARGIEHYPLYRWTKATVDDPAKKAKYLESFTVYVGGAEVYDKAVADALEADLQPLVGGPLIKRMTKHDTNPAKNPQMPEQYRSS